MENQLYDEFTYHWITAVNGKTPPTIDSVNVPTIFFADGNQDGFITMDEAYLYAADLDDSDENPQMESHPECLGHALALDALSDCLPIPGWDLYIKDDDRDYGDEPNLITPYPWICADIWYEEDGQKIEILQSGETYDVCVKVRNRGEEISPGNATLYVHWTKATIGSTWPWGWYSQYTYDCNGTSVRRGDMIGSIVLPPIAGGESYVARIPWTTPDVEEYSPCLEFAGDNYAELWHYCMLARIVDDQEQPDETITDLNLADFVFNYNNVVSRNVILTAVQNGGTSPAPSVDITNPRPGQDSGPYSLTCGIEGVADWEHIAEIRLTFDPVFMSSQSYMTWSHCYAINNQYGSFYLEDGAQFEEIYFWADDNNTYPIRLNIDYYDTEYFYPKFVIYLVLRDRDGYVVNGELFEFKNNRPDLANVIKRPTYTDEPENEIEQQSIIQEEALSIDVYNMQGVHLKHCDNCDMQSLNLPKGIYIYRIQGKDESFTKKVIK
ncbi:MAG: T9SS type A sorting domain-containing protein [Paludibacteraceae bacterium]|nr:T9SS type A sorting domain-containing protein [Paludibacteraceae bacterium]